jgi:CheY-like chemotaxis protein
VLVAENEPSLERLARQVLEGLGYRVVTARDGREAVTVYDARRGERKTSSNSPSPATTSRVSAATTRGTSSAA